MTSLMSEKRREESPRDTRRAPGGPGGAYSALLSAPQAELLPQKSRRPRLGPPRFIEKGGGGDEREEPRARAAWRGAWAFLSASLATVRVLPRALPAGPGRGRGISWHVANNNEGQCT